MTAFHAGLADIFEVDESDITPDFDLASHTWDSLAIVSTIALIDECCNHMVDGRALANCVTVGDIEALIAAVSAKVA
jgi:acyl carrier protein